MNLKRVGDSNVFRSGKDIYTLAPASDSGAVYGERLVKQGEEVYRRWNPKRSKLCGAFHTGLDPRVLGRGGKVVYLGAADGTTVSHVCDAVGKKGQVVAVEFSPYSFGHLMQLASRRVNLIPVLGDAKVPKKYQHMVSWKADMVFQDIAQRTQVEIFVLNCKAFLSANGMGVLALKARSIDVGRSPDKIFSDVRGELAVEFSKVKMLDISRFEKDHAVFVVHSLR